MRLTRGLRLMAQTSRRCFRLGALLAYLPCQTFLTFSYGSLFLTCIPGITESLASFFLTVLKRAPLPTSVTPTVPRVQLSILNSCTLPLPRSCP